MKTLNGIKPDSYFELIKKMPLRSIQNDEQLAEAQTMLDELLARDLDQGEEVYLDALTDLIEKYESDTIDFGDATCAQILQFLIEDRSVTQNEIAVGADIPKSTVSELLHGKRKASVELAKKLGVFFGVDPSAFLDWNI